MNSRYLLLLTVVFIFGTPCLGFAQQPFINNKNVIIVHKDIVNGIQNKVEKVPWHSGLTLGEAIALGGGFQQDHFSFSVVSGKTITLYDESVNKNEKVLQDVVLSGDVVVLGMVDSERASDLDKIEEIKQNLGCKWNECKNRVQRTISKAEATSSP